GEDLGRALAAAAELLAAHDLQGVGVADRAAELSALAQALAGAAETVCRAGITSANPSPAGA
ncbi:hypothetical protein ACFU6O_30155, partial [Streptomyces albidoflavus]